MSRDHPNLTKNIHGTISYVDNTIKVRSYIDVAVNCELALNTSSFGHCRAPGTLQGSLDTCQSRNPYTRLFGKPMERLSRYLLYVHVAKLCDQHQLRIRRIVILKGNFDITRSHVLDFIYQFRASFT
jgi:hypothetical protein